MVTVEYVVAGPVLVLIGIAQVWLKRWNALDEARRAAEAAGAGASERETGDSAGAGGDTTGSTPAHDEAASRKPPLWDAWTGILGYVAMALGVVVLVMGLLGK